MRYVCYGQIVEPNAPKQVEPERKIIAWGSKDGRWVRAEDKELRPDRDMFTEAFYQE